MRYTVQSLRSLLAITLFSLLFLFSTTAAAIDGYKSREQLFVGFGLGGGPGAVHVGDEALSTGLDQGGAMGLHLHGIVGGGYSEQVVLGAELNTWLRNSRLGDEALSHYHWSFLANADVFLYRGFYAGAGLGLAYGITDAREADREILRIQELGWAIKGNAGFEYFLNGTVAAGFRFSYTRHFYQNVDFDTFQGAITLRWY